MNVVSFSSEIVSFEEIVFAWAGRGKAGRGSARGPARPRPLIRRTSGKGLGRAGPEPCYLKRGHVISKAEPRYII